MNLNGNIPILGGEGGPVKAPVQGFAAIAREIDENGMVDCETSQRLSNGQVVGVAGRGAYMDANELLDAIEEIVRRVVYEEMVKAAFDRGLSLGQKVADKKKLADD